MILDGRLRCRSSNRLIERIQGPSQRVIIEMLGFDAGRKEPCDRFLLEKVRMAVAKAPPPLVQRALPSLNHLSSGSTLQTSKKMKTISNNLRCLIAFCLAQ